MRFSDVNDDVSLSLVKCVYGRSVRGRQIMPQAKIVEIVNPKVTEDLNKGIPIGIDLGCGDLKREGFYGVDRHEMDGNTDIIADLNEPFHLLPDDCAAQIYLCHVQEHIQNVLPLIKEIYRVARKDCNIEIIVSHLSDPYFYSDPTHGRFLGLYSMYYFANPDKQALTRKVPSFYSNMRFVAESIKITLHTKGNTERVCGLLFSSLINKNIFYQDLYDRRTSKVFVAGKYNIYCDQISYIVIHSTY